MARMRVRRGVHHNELHIMGRCVVQWSNDWTTWRTLTTVTDEDMLVVFLDCAPHPHRVYAASDEMGRRFVVNAEVDE